MEIERTEPIRFHEEGTLKAVTRWITTHADGLAEWLKNVRRQYRSDRAAVEESHCVAILLLQDEKDGNAARIGMLDVGGATLEDVTAWSVWQDPDASGRRSGLDEEETQGNGGKTYMFRLFNGPARILGVRDQRLNCKGFAGGLDTKERGTPGWIPSLASGRDLEISSFDAELAKAIEPYGITKNDLPSSVRTAIFSRKAFTLVEGEQPIELYKGRIDDDDLISKLVRHEQATLALEQVSLFAIHNGAILNGGKPLSLPPIAPYPGLESPLAFEIPDQLPLDGGQLVSTTENSTKDRGRLTLHTSKDSMPQAHKNLRPRWQITYRTRHQMIGAKSVGELSPGTPGSGFVYGTVELPALEPAYVEHGRRRPKNGPLVEALDAFVAEKIRELASQINARRKQELDSRALDEVQKENQKLDEFKNKFLPDFEDNTGGGPGGRGGGKGGAKRGPIVWGTVPESLELEVPEGGLQIGKGVNVDLRSFLRAGVKDSNGRPVRAPIEWKTSTGKIANVSADGSLRGNEKGVCTVWARVKGTTIESDPINVRVWAVDHVLLTPRTLEIGIGAHEQITAEVTDDEGHRSTDVLLAWQHDADDQLIVRVGPQGVVTGNRIGRTAINAGADGVLSRIPVEVKVVENPAGQERGSGFPRLLLTGRDPDPSTGAIREGDPDQPVLWQEPVDYNNNVWWLNLQSPEAAFAFRERSASPSMWRLFHAEKLIEMVIQVWMTDEFTRKGEQQRPDFWAPHLLAMDRHRVRIVQEMWKGLQTYVNGGVLLEEAA